MKKIAFLLSMLALAFAGHAGIVITTSVTVGRPSQGCKGVGLCKVETTTEHPSRQAKMQLLDGKNQLKVVFPATLIQAFPEGLRDELKGGFFSQPEQLTLPADVCRLLGAKTGLTLMAGKYAATQAGTETIIVFDIRPVAEG